MKRKLIRRICGCGDCGRITNYGKRYISGHNKPMLGKKQSDATKKKMAVASKGNTNRRGKKCSEESKAIMSIVKIGKKPSEETKKKISLGMMGNINALNYKHTEETKLKISIGNTKSHPNDKYCEIWRDREYKKDIRKDYCENKNCKNNYKCLGNHHIYLDKKRCAPEDTMTLCNPCHAILHWQLQNNKSISVNPKDFVIINRQDHVSYINKSTQQIIRIERRI